MTLLNLQSTMSNQQSTYNYLDILNLLLIVGSFPLNCCILLFVMGSAKLRKQHNIFTFNMALIDLTTAAITTLLVVHQNAGVFNLKVMCANCASALWKSCTVISSLNILILAVYRFVSVHIDPFGVQNLVTTPRCVFACAMAWILGSFPCIELLVQTEIGFWISLTILVVFIVVGVCYALLYRGLTRSSPRDRGVGVNEQRLREDRRLLKTFAAIYLTSFTLWLPTFVIGLMQTEDLTKLAVTTALYSANMIANPIIFWLRSREFKAVLKSCIWRNRVLP